jgi:DNA-binding MarR family transcriptional regulator
MTRPAGKSTTDRGALVEAIGAAARAQQRALDLFDQAVVDHVGLNRTDGRCIDIIAEVGPISAGDLARAAHLTTGAVTTVLDRLERAGWVRRTSDPADRRRVLVAITDKTLGLMKRIFLPVKADGERELEQFSDEQLAAILAYLHIDRALHETHAGQLEVDGPYEPER